MPRKKPKREKRRFGAIRQLPSGRWQARYLDHLGVAYTAPETFPKREDAERYLNAVETDLNRGVHVDPRKAKVTFAVWAAEYQAGAVHKRASTRDRDDQTIRKHLLPLFGRKPLGSITPLDVRRFVTSLSNTYEPSTVRTIYGVLRAVMTAAVEADYLAVSPCRGVKLPPKRPTEKRVLTPDELERLAAAMPARHRPIAYLGGVLGLRWSEIAGLRVKRIDFLRGRILIAETLSETGGFVYTDTKTASSRRTLPLPPFLSDMLAEHLAARGAPGPDEPVFVTPTGKPLRSTNFHRDAWKSAVEKATLAGLTFHGLRHSAAGQLIAQGVHPKVIQAWLGHASIVTTMDVYGALIDGAMDGVTAALEATFGGRSGTHLARPVGSDDAAQQK